MLESISRMLRDRCRLCKCTKSEVWSQRGVKEEPKHGECRRKTFGLEYALGTDNILDYLQAPVHSLCKLLTTWIMSSLSDVVPKLNVVSVRFLANMEAACGGDNSPIVSSHHYELRARSLLEFFQTTDSASHIAVSSQVKFDEICPAPSLILIFVPSCSIMLIPAPPLLRVRSEDPSVYAVEGRGLAILIKNLYYEDIAVNITNTLDLEAQEKFWNFKKANMIYFENTIIKAAKVSIPRALIIFSMKKINMKELAYALENTDLNKTPGPDGIHGRLISNLGKIGEERLLNIFNNSWKTGKLPQDCKNATIIPIKKHDKSADDPKNYRPISLTNICCKLMEKIILRRLTYHPDTRNLLPEEQYGFRKGHGTIDQLLFFTQKQNRKLSTVSSRDRGEADPGRLCSLTAEEKLSCHVVGFLKKLAVISQQLTLDRAPRPPSLFLHTHYPWTIQDAVACIHIPFSTDAIRIIN
ncbi:hypothetical protein LAZ67_19001437 [Cordylochernes scorpioides]|uniref:Reverse transcriptase domain-containing protein n=1 Tax=Cordylochernes scorpioides TaxID=51811 RepID=A0ABY6LMG2_9ARAC|nr:hypothetical protein LAZ67_19001437 [Cordylochernes scorpioides]